VALVDLDLQFGSVADRLSAHGRGSIRDLIEAGNRLDADLMAAIARPAASGIKVFAAPEEIRALEDVPTERMIDVLDLLRRHYGHVVLDLPLNLTNWLIFSLMGADAIVMVVEMTIPSLHQARRRLDLLRSIGVPDGHVHLVVNRVERRLFRTIGLQDVARTLGQTVLGSVALEAPAVAAAQERGELLIGHRGRFVSDIATIARRLTDVWQGGEA
jgi:pilus assembly protein CpaE